MKSRLVAGLLAATLSLCIWLPVQAEAPATGAVAPALAAPPSLPPAAGLGPLIYISQTWNNCGPASVAEVLNYWGIQRTQAEVQAVLRADGNPGGMAPFGMPGYLRGLGMSALLATGGSDVQIKGLLAAGFPVIVSQWVSLSDHYGHYRPIQSYDEARGVFVSSDPYLGPNHAIGYDEFDKIWDSNNRRFYVIYPPAKAAQVSSILSSSGWDAGATYMSDIAIQQARISGNPQAAPVGWGYRAGYSALSIAWDNLQLGDIPSAQRALDYARAHGTSPVVTGWIADEIQYRLSTAG